jgi:hypothetical protein
VQEEWKRTYGAAAPFGNLRAMWSNEACARVTPLGGPCPYAEERCAMAFLSAVQTVTATRRRSPTGYFRSVARSMGIDMADNKPLSREANREAHLFAAEAAPGSGDTDRPGNGDAAGPQGDDPARPDASPDLRRTIARPIAIGALLGSLHLGAREDGSAHGREGAQ